MVESHEKFKNIAEGIRSLLIGAAVVVGGFWAIYEFSSLQKIEKAKEELESLQKRNFQQASLEIDLEARSIDEPEGFSVIGSVSITNVGTRNAHLEFPEATPPITVSKVHYGDAGELVYGKRYNFSFSDHEFRTGAATAIVGRTLRFPFLLKVEEAGMYLIVFQSGVRAEDDDLPQEIKESANVEVTSWQETMLLKVGIGAVANTTENLTNEGLVTVPRHEARY